MGWTQQTSKVVGLGAKVQVEMLLVRMYLAGVSAWSDTVTVCRQQVHHVTGIMSTSTTSQHRATHLTVKHTCLSSCSSISTLQRYALPFRPFSVPSVLWRCWLGGRKGIRPVKNWVVGCWHGYLSVAMWRFAYGPADATATLSLAKRPSANSQCAEFQHSRMNDASFAIASSVNLFQLMTVH